MKKLAAALAATLALAACGGSSEDAPLSPAARLEGKTWLMTGADVPSHPNGFSEDLNLGAATQCYQSTKISVLAGAFAVESKLGVIEGTAPDTTCNPNPPSPVTLTFSSQSVAYGTAAVPVTGRDTADCFDILVNYGTFKQAGRGSISADGLTLRLELFFEGQAVGATCADGAVGSGITTLNTLPFAGDAVQVYRKQP